MSKNYPPLTAYRVTMDDGSSYSTNMAANITLEQARRYFIGQPQEQADEKTILRAVSVEPIDHPDLFIGIYAGGIVYADRTREEQGDYQQLAFLPYRELVLDMKPDVPNELQWAIATHAVNIIARRGCRLEIDGCGHGVILGA